MTPEEIKFNNYSNASKLRMAALTKTERVLRARKAAQAAHALRTPEQRQVLAQKMVLAKKNKWLQAK